MPRGITQEKLEINREIVLETYDSFGRTPGATKEYPIAAATRGISQDLVLTKVKPELKHLLRGMSREEIRNRWGKNIFLSEACGTYPKYQEAILTTALHMIDIDGTPLKNLELATFFVIDSGYMPNYFRTKGTLDLPERPVPLGDARPKYYFRKYLGKLLVEAKEKGHVDFDEQKEILYRVKIDPVKFSADFWPRRMVWSKSGWRRHVIGMKVGMHAPEFRQIFPLIRDFHHGDVYKIKKSDPENWFLLVGPEGAGFSFIDRSTQRAYLQYAKAGLSDVDWKETESEAHRKVDFTISRLNWVSENLLKEMFPKEFSAAVAAWNKTPEVAPFIIGDCYAPKKLGIQLKWASKKPLDTKLHTAGQVLSNAWQYLSHQFYKPGKEVDFDKMEEVSNVVITFLKKLSDGETVKATTATELSVMGTLSEYVEKTPSGYMLKKGMQDAVSSLNLYAGIL